MQQFRVEVSSLVVAVLLFLVPVSNASEHFGTADAKWSRSRIVLSISNSLVTAPNLEGDAAEAVRHSIEAWTKSADLQIEVLETDSQNASPKGIRGDGISLITAASTAENLRLFPKQADSPAAATRIFIDRRGNITEADIVINPFVRFSTDGSYGTFDLQATITHEIGHLLGLDHSPVWGSVMFDKAAPSFGPSLRFAGKRSLPDADAASLRALYGSKPEDFVCCGMVSGRLTGVPASAKQRKIGVWLEDVDTGRLVAATSVTNGVDYEIAGLSEGSYRVRVAVEAGENAVASAEGLIRVEVADVVRKDLHLTTVSTSLSVNLVGATAQIAKMPAVFTTGSQRTLFVGGKFVEDTIAGIQISGTGISFRPEEFRVSDYGGSVKVIGFDLPTEPNLASGIYSLVIEDIKGAKRFLIGAIVVSTPQE